MKYSLTFLDAEYAELIKHLFIDRLRERAAYILCRFSNSKEECRLLVKEVIPVAEMDIEESSEVHMRIKPLSFVRAMKKANNQKQLFIFAHSHPIGFTYHSSKDNTEEKQLFRTAYNRIRTVGVHGSIVISSEDKPVGRVWLEDGSTKPMYVIRSMGDRFRFYFDNQNIPLIPPFFDRQVRAFGSDIQSLLQRLHIGVVGCGGTGSAVAEQLIRLGVGKLTVADGQAFEKTNINRVYGSTFKDDGIPKVELINRLAQQIGLGTDMNAIPHPISFASTINQMKNTDLIFGCTDDHWGRSILTKLAVYYGIPIFDLGVKIDSKDGIIKSIQGRVTILLGHYACLFCRERINGKDVQIESLAELDPEQLKRLIKAGYADELPDPSPAVISFTTMIASLAISEFIHRLTGYMGNDRHSNEVLMLFDQLKIRTNRVFSKEGCFCGDNFYLMRGDTKPLLDLTWRPEKQ
jgi:hypothetical protein